MEELHRLLDRGKPTLVAVTKFDETIEDIDLETGELVGQIVAKPAESRQEQEGWLEEQVEAAGLGDILQDRRYSFVSSALAEGAALADDSTAFAEEGWVTSTAS